jgi:hypothetical protein
VNPEPDDDDDDDDIDPKEVRKQWKQMNETLQKMAKKILGEEGQPGDKQETVTVPAPKPAPKPEPEEEKKPKRKSILDLLW